MRVGAAVSYKDAGAPYASSSTSSNPLATHSSRRVTLLLAVSFISLAVFALVSLRGGGDYYASSSSSALLFPPSLQAIRDDARGLLPASLSAEEANEVKAVAPHANAGEVSSNQQPPAQVASPQAESAETASSAGKSSTSKPPPSSSSFSSSLAPLTSSVCEPLAFLCGGRAWAAAKVACAGKSAADLADDTNGLFVTSSDGGATEGEEHKVKPSSDSSNSGSSSGDATSPNAIALSRLAIGTRAPLPPVSFVQVPFLSRMKRATLCADSAEPLRLTLAVASRDAVRSQARLVAQRASREVRTYVDSAVVTIVHFAAAAAEEQGKSETTVTAHVSVVAFRGGHATIVLPATDISVPPNVNPSNLAAAIGRAVLSSEAAAAARAKRENFIAPVGRPPRPDRLWAQTTEAALPPLALQQGPLNASSPHLRPLLEADEKGSRKKDESENGSTLPTSSSSSSSSAPHFVLSLPLGIDFTVANVAGLCLQDPILNEESEATASYVYARERFETHFAGLRSGGRVAFGERIPLGFIAPHPSASSSSYSAFGSSPLSDPFLSADKGGEGGQKEGVKKEGDAASSHPITLLSSCRAPVTIASPRFDSRHYSKGGDAVLRGYGRFVALGGADSSSSKPAADGVDGAEGGSKGSTTTAHRANHGRSVALVPFFGGVHKDVLLYVDGLVSKCAATTSSAAISEKNSAAEAPNSVASSSSSTPISSAAAADSSSCGAAPFMTSISGSWEFSNSQNGTNSLYAGCEDAAAECERDVVPQLTDVEREALIPPIRRPLGPRCSDDPADPTRLATVMPLYSGFISDSRKSPFFLARTLNATSLMTPFSDLIIVSDLVPTHFLFTFRRLIAVSLGLAKAMYLVPDDLPQSPIFMEKDYPNPFGEFVLVSVNRKVTEMSNLPSSAEWHVAASKGFYDLVRLTEEDIYISQDQFSFFCATLPTFEKQNVFLNWLRFEFDAREYEATRGYDVRHAYLPDTYVAPDKSAIPVRGWTFGGLPFAITLTSVPNPHLAANGAAEGGTEKEKSGPDGYYDRYSVAEVPVDDCYSPQHFAYPDGEVPNAADLVAAGLAAVPPSSSSASGGGGRFEFSYKASYSAEDSVSFGLRPGDDSKTFDASGCYLCVRSRHDVFDTYMVYNAMYMVPDARLARLVWGRSRHMFRAVSKKYREDVVHFDSPLVTYEGGVFLFRAYPSATVVDNEEANRRRSAAGNNTPTAQKGGDGSAINGEERRPTVRRKVVASRMMAINHAGNVWGLAHNYSLLSQITYLDVFERHFVRPGTRRLYKGRPL